MALIDVLNILFTADTNDLDKKVKKSTSTLQDFGKIFAAGAVFAAGKAAFETLAEGVKALAFNAINLADELEAMSKSSGVSIDSLYELRYIATKCDTEFESLVALFPKMSMNIDKATDASTEQAKALKDLGLNTKDLLSLSPEESFFKIVQALSKVDNSYHRASLGAALFGKGFKDVNGLVAEGGKSLEDLRKRYQELGGGQAYEGMLALKDLWDDLSAASENFGAALASGAAPGLLVLAAAFEEVVKSVTGLSGAFDAAKFGAHGAIAATAGWLDYLHSWVADLSEVEKEIGKKYQDVVKAENKLRDLKGVFWSDASKAELEHAQAEIDRLNGELAALQVKRGKQSKTPTMDAVNKAFDKAEEDRINGVNKKKPEPQPLPQDETKSKQVEDLDKFIEKLKEENEWIGKNATADEKRIAALDKLYATGKSNLDKMKIMEARTLVFENGKKEAAAKKLKDDQQKKDEQKKKDATEWDSAAKKYKEEAMTPDQKYKKVQQEINALYNGGELTKTEANRAEKKHFDEIYQVEKPKVTREIKFGGAMERGSQEAQSTLNRTMFGTLEKDPNKKVYEETVRQTTVLKNIEKKLPEYQAMNL